MAEVINTGTLSAGRHLTITAANLESPGTLAAGVGDNGAITQPGNLTIAVTDRLRSAGAAAKNYAGSSIRLSGRSLDLAGSETWAKDAVALTAGTGGIDLRSAKLSAGGDLKILSQGSIDNRDGGNLVARNITLDTGNSFNNDTGTLEARESLDLHAGGTVTNDGGIIWAGNSLVIESAGLSGKGDILSRGDLSITLSRDYSLAGNVEAAGSATLKIGGTVFNQGGLRAGNVLKLDARAIENSGTGEIEANRIELRAIGISNRGLINAKETRIEGISLSNLGGGRIYGDDLSLAAQTLNNASENGVSPVIAARKRLDIGVTHLDNSDGALIYSEGDIVIGGHLDANDHAAGQAASVTNSSATIEAAGNILVNADQVINKRSRFSVSQAMKEEGTEYAVHEFRPGGPWGLFSAAWVEKTQTVVDVDSGEARFLAGGSISFNGAVTNDKSSIAAGRDILLDESRYTGTAQLGQTHSSARGVMYYCIYCAYGGFGFFSGKFILGDPFQTPGLEGRAQSGVRDTLNYVRSIATPELLQEWRKTGMPENLGDGFSPYSASDVVTTETPLAPARLTANQAITGTATQISNVNEGGGLGQTPVRAELPATSSTIRVPDNALYTLHPGTTGGYLVETDPRFTNYRTWLSSDYMLTALGFDPAQTGKRLGDGFYEQKLLREQVTSLTGMRFLGAYRDDETQYRALLDRGIAYAKAYQLTPGIALTATQMATLTNDMVWLVEREVTLPDGSLARALVPQLYSPTQDRSDANSGALIRAGNIDLQVSGSIINSGTLAAERVLVASADNINNLGGRVRGAQVALIAATDINNVGGEIAGDDLLALQAGRNIHLTSTTTESSETGGRLFQQRRTAVDRVAELRVNNANGTLDIRAGQDITLTGARIDSAGTARLQAGNTLSLDTIATRETRNIDIEDDVYEHRRSQSEAGTRIDAKGDLKLLAGSDLNIRAGTVASHEGSITLDAGRNIVIASGESVRQEERATKNVAGKRISTSRESEYRSEVLASVINAGQDLNISAGDPGLPVPPQSAGSLTVRGSALAAGGELVVQTAGDFNLLAASNRRYDTVMRSAVSRKKMENLNYELDQTRQLLSTLSAGSSIKLNVGGDLNAQTGTRDADGNLQADRVTKDGILKGSDRQQVSLTHTSNKAGTTINGPTSKVLGELAAQGIRSGATDTFGPEAMQSGQAALATLINSGLLSLKDQPAVRAALATPPLNGAALTRTDTSGNIRLTVAGQAKVQAVYSQLRLSETYDVRHFADQQMAQIVTLIAAIALTIATGGAAAGTLGATMTAAGTTSAAMINAAIIGMASTMTGQLAAGASLSEAFQAGIKAGATSAFTAGVAYGVSDAMGLNPQLDASGNVVKDSLGKIQYATEAGQKYAALGTLDKLGSSTFWTQAGINATASGIASVANGGNFGQGLAGGIASALGASGAGAIGDATRPLSLDNLIAHAVLGCAGAVAGRQDCGTGALGGAGSALIAPLLGRALAPDGPLSTEKQIAVATGSVAATMAIARALDKDPITAGNAARNEVLNNYLKHGEAKKLEELQNKKFTGQCDLACDQQIKALTALDAERNQALAGCSGNTGTLCDGVRQEVRSAAAEYLRANQNSPGRYGEERTETERLARSTLTGVQTGIAAGAGQTFVEGVAGLVQGAATGLKALLGDPSAQAQVRQSAGAAYEAITNLDNLPYLLGAMTPQTREQLARAYEKGDGKAVGELLGQQLASLPLPGPGPLGTIKKIDKTSDLATLAKAPVARIDTVGSPPLAWKPATQLSPNEARQLLDAALPSGAKIDNVSSADVVNAAAVAKGYDAPLMAGTIVTEFTTTRTTGFVRVFAEGSKSEQVGSWVMRAEDVAGLTPAQIAIKYSLPQVPTMMTDVLVPTGTKIQASVANNILHGTHDGGGGVQFQIQVPSGERIDNSWFSNVKPLR